MNIEEIIEKASKGRGEAYLAYTLDVTQFAVRQWVTRGRIPRRHWRALCKMAGCTKEDLRGLNESLRRERASKTN